MKNVLAVSIALATLPVLVQAADITEVPSSARVLLFDALEGRGEQLLEWSHVRF